MRTHLRKVGNSRGVIIPAALLEACELGEEVDLRVEGKTLVIEALRSPRKNWFDGYRVEGDVDAWPALPDDAENGEWEW
jgi:antitoxin MazE